MTVNADAPPASTGHASHHLARIFFDTRDLLNAMVNERALFAGLGHVHVAEWATDAVDLALPGEEFGGFCYANGWLESASRLEDGSLISVRLRHGTVSCHALAKTRQRAKALLDELRTLLPAANRKQGERVAVNFWSLARDGSPFSAHRLLDVPRWATVESNYHGRTRTQISRLLSVKPDASAGKLILWHGAPGTGKTYALRALVREWRSWASAHYIVDPEHFFGASPSYMLRVILGEDLDYGPSEHHSADGWRLLIMEDTGELLTRDAKQQSGQGLSRLLNVCDGLIGQGLRVIVLITTNEDLGVMHPAVTRAGRCLANIRFDALTADEVQRWAVDHGVTDPPGSGLLADLYSGGDAPAQHVVGFRLPGVGVGRA